jgi:hypothetical protein|tara:strand:+ start:35865 stop:36926 length:1062 start_codon:yes stop_codon:yes gene_type:complete
MGSVSHSRVDSYLTCRRKEYYSYHRKLTKIDNSTGLVLGTAIHRVLAALYQHVLDAGNSLAAQKKAYPEAVKVAWLEVDRIYSEGFEDTDKRAPLRLIIEKYLQREPFIDREWHDNKRQWRILGVEKEFNLEYDSETGGRYPFVIDLIVQDPTKKIVVVDHKGLYDFYSYETTNLMPQIPKYIGALRALNYNVSYGMYNMIRTRPESKGNKLNKAELVELLSKSDIGEIDPKMKVTELEAIADEHDIPYYEGRVLDDWAFAMEIQPSGVRVQRSFLEQINASMEVAELDTLDDETRDIKAYRIGNSMICKSCPFKDICSEELRGGNVALLLQTEYKIKDKRDEILVSEELSDE